MKILQFVFLIFVLSSCGDAVKQKEYKSPDQLFPDLFIEVQKSGIFSSSKIFADAISKSKPELILEAYKNEKIKPGFNLKSFVNSHFIVKDSAGQTFLKSDDFNTYLQKNFLALVRKPKDDGGSLVPTRTEYISGGVTNDEFSYWTAYANYLALKKIKKSELANGLIANCAQFIESFGHVPIGNRSYYLERSSLPVLALLLNESNDNETLLKFLPQLNREYQYWMSVESKEDQKNIQENLKKGIKVYKKSVFVNSENTLNRFFEESEKIRPECYKEDFSVTGKKQNILNNRIIESSSWPEKSRWLDNQSFNQSVFVGNILPVDLNAIMYIYEKTLSKAYLLKGKKDYSQAFASLAQKRKMIFNSFFWNAKMGFYTDYDFVSQAQRQQITLAGLLPLLTDIPSAEQKKLIIQNTRKYLLNANGLILSSIENQVQPEWMLLALKCLDSAGEIKLSGEIKNQWLDANKKNFSKNGGIILNTKAPSNRIDGAFSTLIYLNNSL